MDSVSAGYTPPRLMPKIGMYNEFAVAPSQRGVLVDRLTELGRVVIRFPGCRLFVVNESTQGAGIVWVTEIWDSEDEHRVARHDAEVDALIRQNIFPLLARRPGQIKVRAMAGFGMGGDF